MKEHTVENVCSFIMTKEGEIKNEEEKMVISNTYFAITF